MALTASATETVENDIKLLLQNPVISKSSVNQPNITLNVEELSSDLSSPAAVQFLNKAEEIINSMLCIYRFNSRHWTNCKNFKKWEQMLQNIMERWMHLLNMNHMSSRSQGRYIQIILATKAFGMGIDKPDIHHLFRMESLNVCYLGLKSQDQLVEMASEHVQQYCIINQTSPMLTHAY